MAWQLIYTSAPRLLEAGRSGFGTVARHRQISPLLVSAVERASQFARLPGHDAGRVVFSHRLLAAGGARFHVLSCIRDSGADHTRRTNHLAHHLIAEEREIAKLSGHGPSPADVLLGMAWATGWAEVPRYFEAGEEIDLARFASRASGAWARATGDATHARLLTSAEAGRGTYLIAPPGVEVCALFGESLRLVPERAWRVRFTSSLQPSDDAADFDWIGLEADSPLRAQTGAGGRAVFDLTNPRSLPAIEAPPLNRPAARASAPVAVTPKTSQAPRAKPQTVDPFGDYKPARTLPRKAFVAGGAIVFVLVGAALLFPWYRGLEEQKRQRAEIINALKSTGLFDTAKTRGEFARELDHLNAANLPKAREVAEAAAALATTLNKPAFDALRRTPAMERLKVQAQAAGFVLPAEISSVALALDDAAKLEGWLQQFPATKASDADYDELSRRILEVASLGANLSPEQGRAFDKVREHLETLAARRQAAALRALLEASLPPSREIAWFRAEEKKLRADAQSAPDVKRVSALLDDWSAVQNGSAEDVGKRAALNNVEWPKWLLTEARKKAPGVTVKAADTAKAAPVAPQAAAASGAPLYIVRGLAGLKDFSVPELSSGLTYFFRASFTSEPVAFIEPAGRGMLLRKDRVNSPPAFSVSGTSKKIVPESGSNEFPLPFVLLVRNAAADVAQLWVVPTTESPLLPKSTKGLTRDGATLRLDPAIPALPGPLRNPLRLRLPESWALPGATVEALKMNDWTADLSPLRTALEDARKKLVSDVERLKKGLDSKDEELKKEFQAQADKLIDAAGLRSQLSMKRSQVAADLKDKSAPLSQQCGGYIVAVCRVARFKGVEALSADGAALRYLDPVTDAKAQRDAMTSALEHVRGAQRELRNAEKTTDYLRMLRALEGLLAVLTPETPEETAARIAADTQMKAQLVADEGQLLRLDKHPVLSKALPPGTYPVLAVFEGEEIPLLEIEIAP